jgi:hypothetical protein
MSEGTLESRQAPAAARPEAGSSRVLLHDDFRRGFDSAETWHPLPRGPLPAGDGVVSAGDEGLLVLPTATHPVTGEPAFGVSLEPDDPAGGTADHIKWLAFPRRTASSGRPGFDIPRHGELVCAVELGGECFGVSGHPFGGAVADPDSDVRLAAADMITADFETDTVFDFALTNATVYAIYERLRSPGSTHASYSYAVPVGERSPDRFHRLEIRFGDAGRSVSWWVDGERVLEVDRIGTRALPRRHMILDHGGVEEEVALRQIICGVGTFTVLDGAGGDGRALVRVDSTEDYYYSVREGQPRPQRFVDERSESGNRLWGQGAVLRVRSVLVATVG